MIANGMTAPENLFKEFGKHLHILSKTEEGSFGTILVQLIQDPRSNLRARTIVKSKEDGILNLREVPDEGRKEPSYYFGRINLHISFYVAKIVIKMVNFAE